MEMEISTRTKLGTGEICVDRLIIQSSNAFSFEGHSFLEICKWKTTVAQFSSLSLTIFRNTI